MAQVQEASRRVVARFPRRSSRGVMFGLGALQLLLIGIGLVMLILCLLSGQWIIFGPVALVAFSTAPTWFTGKPLAAWVPHLGIFAVRGIRGQLKFRKRVMKPRPVGTLGLPGDAARLRIYVEEMTGAGLIHDPTSRTLTAIARATPAESFALAEAAQQDTIAEGFGSLLEQFCTDSSNGITRVGSLIRSVSDGGEEIAKWFRDKGSPELSTPAHEAYEEYLRLSRTDTMRHEGFVSITLNMKAKGVESAIRQSGGGVAGGATVLRNRMDYLAGQMSAAALTFNGWVGAGGVGRLVRTAYDPGSQAGLEANPGVGESAGGAGPISVDESFLYFRTEGAFHRVLLVVEWPRKQSTAGFLQHLIIARVRHTFSIVFEPIPPRKAMNEARRASTGATTSQMWQSKSGGSDTPERKREREQLEQEENALEAGEGALRFAGMVTVSGSSLDELNTATEQVRTAALRSGCELRTVGGEQCAAFVAAALPFGRGL